MTEIQIKNKQLCEKYPFLQIRRRDGSIKEEYGATYVDFVPNGWKNLFLQMCDDLVEPLSNAGLLYSFYFLQIKEKYGELRCYTTYTVSIPKEVNTIIEKYCHISNYVCEHCGKPAAVRTYGWITNLCEDCFEKANKQRKLKENKYDRISWEPVMKKWQSLKEATTNEIDCSEEWNRLYKK